MGLIRGETVSIGGADYVVPPFTIGQWERFDALAASYAEQQGPTVPQMVRHFAPLLIENVQRNYPDFAFTPDDFDLPTFVEVRSACLATARKANPPQAPANLSTGAP